MARSRSLRRLLAGIGFALAAFVGITAWALESGSVAEIGTVAIDGSIHTTRVWFAEPGGELWLEAGTPDNQWFLDVGRDPRVSFSAAGHSGAFVAEVIPTPDARRRIRSLIREKYGLRDVWVGIIVDTSRSVAVRLVPASADTAR